MAGRIGCKMCNPCKRCCTGLCLFRSECNVCWRWKSGHINPRSLDSWHVMVANDTSMCHCLYAIVRGSIHSLRHFIVSLASYPSTQVYVFARNTRAWRVWFSFTRCTFPILQMKDKLMNWSYNSWPKIGWNAISRRGASGTRWKRSEIQRCMCMAKSQFPCLRMGTINHVVKMEKIGPCTTIPCGLFIWLDHCLDFHLAIPIATRQATKQSWWPTHRWIRLHTFQ